MDKLINLLKFIFYISLIFLIVIYLFPGSLLGYFAFGDFGRQVSLADNPIYQVIPSEYYWLGSVMNHLLFFLFFSTLGLYIFSNNKNLNILFYSLLFFSVFLELLHIIIPKRAFEVYDLAANLIGVLFAYFLIIIYRFLIKDE